MTTIVAVQYEDRCVLAADNQVTDGSGRIYRHVDMAKISERGAFLVAGSGEVQPCDVAQHIWKPPAPTAGDKKNTYHFMITKVMPSLREALKTNGYNFDEAQEKEEDLLDMAWGLEATSRLSCQAMIGDENLVIEIPKYTINHARENH